MLSHVGCRPAHVQTMVALAATRACRIIIKCAMKVLHLRLLSYHITVKLRLSSHEMVKRQYKYIKMTFVTHLFGIAGCREHSSDQ